jgi:hypothetical protein
LTGIVTRFRNFFLIYFAFECLNHFHPSGGFCAIIKRSFGLGWRESKLTSKIVKIVQSMSPPHSHSVAALLPKLAAGLKRGG